MRLPAAVERALAEAREHAAHRETERALAALREQLRSILASVPDALWSLELESGRLLYISDAAREILGRAPEVLVGLDNGWMRYIHEHDRPQVMAVLRSAAEGGVYDNEHRIVHPDGTVRWVSARGRRIDPGDGSPPRIDGVWRDITEQVEQRTRLARLSRIREFTSGVNAALVRLREREHLFGEFCRIAVEVGGISIARVLLLEESGSRLRLAWTSRPATDPLLDVVDDFNRDPASACSLLATALRTGQPVVSNDIAADERAGRRDELARAGSYSVANFPLLVGGRVAGAVALRAAETFAFDSDEVRLLSELTGNLSFALELMDKQAKLDFLAYYDPLTGLANRALFSDRLAQAIETARGDQHKVAVLLFDIERFKSINDTLGTPMGDAVLRRIAHDAEQAAGEGARLARLGGDQFAVLIPVVRDADHVGRMLESRMASMLDTMIEFDGRELRVAAKAGVAFYPEDGTDTDTLLRNAEAALKKAKASAERFVFYEPHLNARVAERLDLEAKLRRATERAEFALHFQPRVELRTNRITGVEALLRWRDPERGMMSPALFVPVLEETGLIHSVGQWAMQDAVATRRVWHARGLAAPRIAVNISAVQLRTRTFVDEVRAVVGDAGEAAGLDLEITESLLMENIEESLRKLREIRDLGVHIALDDFGTGYSSLGYLSRLPIDTVKIDRVFIHNMTAKSEDTSIVTAILSLSRSLGLKVVAEGVETDEQARLLGLLRCDEMQGYLFSRPVPGDELAAMLSSEAGR